MAGMVSRRRAAHIDAGVRADDDASRACRACPECRACGACCALTLSTV
jgi:hypothetical protein